MEVIENNIELLDSIISIVWTYHDRISNDIYRKYIKDIIDFNNQ